MELKRAIKLAENPEAVDAAICCLNRVIEDSRRDGRHQATVPQALYLRSSLHRKGNQFRQPDLGAAFADLSSALHIEPDYCAAWLNRAGILFEQGRLEEALSDISRAIQTFHSPRARWPRSRDSVKACTLHANKAVILDALDRQPEAYYEFTQALDLDPSDSCSPGAVGSCHYKAAAILLKFGFPRSDPQAAIPGENHRVAMSLLVKAVQLNPSHVEACALRGNECLQQKSYGEAISMYKQCLRFCQNAEMIAAVQGNLESARRHFHSALVAESGR